MAIVDNIPKRLVICVDGTWCDPDGPKGPRGNQTNIYRIFASVKTGQCEDPSTGTLFLQEKQYFHGLGSADDAKSIARFQAGIFGQGYLTQIQDVYERCCELSGDGDEVFLLGFSRGAYVVRAVAGLLHDLQALRSAGKPGFSNDFKEALKVCKLMKQSSKLERVPSGQIHHHFAANSRPAPKLRFVGVFDTVKAVDDSSIFDISFNSSIIHFRHALALHEDRRAMTPEVEYPNFEAIRPSLESSKRSFIQAWFVGAHIDMGGSAKQDGLSLYPLQWMLLESIQNGLALQFDESINQIANIDDPIAVAFPISKAPPIQLDDLWVCKAENGITTSMQDLQKVHGVPPYLERYSTKLNRPRTAALWIRKSRECFDTAGSLMGYQDVMPHGTILHPSVYLMLEENVSIVLDTRTDKQGQTLQRNITDWREKMVQSHEGLEIQGFWNEREYNDPEPPQSLRILVCGNTGVGKSTLVNKIFGVEGDGLTPISERTRGRHNVKDEIVFEGRPDLILHDSRGFEAGSNSELKDIEEFLRDRSGAVDINQRLHLIWFCIETSSVRTAQGATLQMFQAISQYARDVPIVVVLTKKDEFTDVKFQRYLRTALKSGKAFDTNLQQECDQYTEQQLHERIKIVEEELLEVPQGRFDTCIAVSKEDEASIAHLNAETSACCTDERIRLVYVAAQTSSLSLKINLSSTEIMRKYRRILGRASTSGLGPIAPTAHRLWAANVVSKTVIQCFGVPSISAETALRIVKANTWRERGNMLCFALGEGIAALGVAGSCCVSGIPVNVLTGTVINVPLLVPAATQLYLMLAADLILVLARAFEDINHRFGGQPSERDVTRAARGYGHLSQRVHNEVKSLLPKHNVTACFRLEKVRVGFETIIEKYRQISSEDLELQPVNSSSSAAQPSQDLDHDIREDTCPAYEGSKPPSYREKASVRERDSLIADRDGDSEMALSMVDSIQDDETLCDFLVEGKKEIDKGKY